ncbi:hypothetical protein BCON_0042g00400 [Botryotinia convoluta]|uniref:Uncharacterized protein n=1 Tax=Botryotinia convoluta TaxID=54673 RepID=A0A4Z1IJD1_9HELO|nr:hypothetical protein BCON_0042g00400 [Botryotinia convoluta]
MSSRFWSHSPLEEEKEMNQKSQQQRSSTQSRPGPWTSEPSTSEERARRANLSNAERQSEARAAREAYDQAQSDSRSETWYQESLPRESRSHRSRARAAPAAPGNSQFFQGSTQPKSAKQQKQEQKAQKAAEKKHRQEARRAAEEEACKEKKHFESMSQWEYAKQWRTSDRAAYGNAFNDFSVSAAAFIKDNTQGFPRLKKHGCARNNCVQGEILGVCHHEVEMTLRGSGAFDEKMMKKERLRWHPDRWTGKGDLQTKANELFQLIQRIIDGDVNA